MSKTRSITCGGVALGVLLSACAGSVSKRQGQPRPAPGATTDKPAALRDDSARWPSLCADLKSALDPAAANVKARPLPPAGGAVDAWTLAVDRLAVSLPRRRDYGLRLRLSPRSVSAVLTSPTVTVLLIRDPPAEPMADVFAKVGGARDRWSERLTREIFGKRPTTFDLLRVGYGHSLADLTCAPGRLRQEVPIGIGLVLKGVASWAREVYLDPHGQRGLLLLGRRGDGCALEAQLQSAEATYVLTNLVRGTGGGLKPCRQRLARLRLAAVGAGAVGGARGPRWLRLLGEALSGGGRQRARWEALAAQLAGDRRAPHGAREAVARLLTQLASGR